MLPRARPRQTSSSYSSSFCWLKKTHQHKSSGSYLIVHLKPVSYGSVLSEEAFKGLGALDAYYDDDDDDNGSREELIYYFNV